MKKCVYNIVVCMMRLIILQCSRCSNMKTPVYCEIKDNKAKCVKCIRDQKTCKWMHKNGTLYTRNRGDTTKMGKRPRMEDEIDESSNDLEGKL